MSRDCFRIPEVGEGATLLMWTDRHACTVYEADEKHLLIREDHVDRVDKNGMSESQEYVYTPNPDGVLSIFKPKLNKKTGQKTWHSKAGGILLGTRQHYYDFSF